MVRNSFFIGLLVSLLFFSACSSKSKVETSNKVVPQYTKFVTMEGDRHVFEELRGKKTAVIFWAQWCRYSRPVIKEMNDMARNRKDANFLAISGKTGEALQNVPNGLDTINYIQDRVYRNIQFSAAYVQKAWPMICK